jgi:hypothetical protein
VSGDNITVGAESNANADVVGDGSANASTDASGSVLKNGQPIGAAETSADGTLDGQGSIDLNSAVTVAKSKTQKAVGAEAGSTATVIGNGSAGTSADVDVGLSHGNQSANADAHADGSATGLNPSAAANADGSAAVSDDSATANANATAEGSADVPTEALSPAVNVLLNTNTNTSATVE